MRPADQTIFWGYQFNREPAAGRMWLKAFSLKKAPCVILPSYWIEENQVDLISNQSKKLYWLWNEHSVTALFEILWFQLQLIDIWRVSETAVLYVIGVNLWLLWFPDFTHGVRWMFALIDSYNKLLFFSHIILTITYS